MRKKPHHRGLQQIVLPPKPGMQGVALVKQLDRRRHNAVDLAVDEYVSPGAVKDVERLIKESEDLGLVVRRVSIWRPAFTQIIELAMGATRIDVPFMPTLCGYPLQPHNEESVTVERIEPLLSRLFHPRMIQ